MRERNREEVERGLRKGKDKGLGEVSPTRRTIGSGLNYGAAHLTGGGLGLDLNLVSMGGRFSIEENSLEVAELGVVLL